MVTDEPAVVLSDDRGLTNDDPVSSRIVRLVAIATDREAFDLEPLGAVVDAEALDALFAPPGADGIERTVRASFRYAGFRVEVAADGTVTLLEASG